MTETTFDPTEYDSITIGGETHTRRREVRSVQIALEALQDRIDDERDAMFGLESRGKHLARQIDALAETEGEFDNARLEVLLEQRRDVRAEERKRSSAILTAQAEAFGMKLEPQRDAEWILENTDNDEYARLNAWFAMERPTEDSATGSVTP